MVVIIISVTVTAGVIAALSLLLPTCEVCCKAEVDGNVITTEADAICWFTDRAICDCDPVTGKAYAYCADRRRLHVETTDQYHFPPQAFPNTIECSANTECLNILTGHDLTNTDPEQRCYDLNGSPAICDQFYLAREELLGPLCINGDCTECAVTSIHPTADPTQLPTVDPTELPSTDPTQSPSIDPTRSPTVDPTQSPSTDPTLSPTFDPISDPTESPHSPTSDPTRSPSVDPTRSPTTDPSRSPTTDPTPSPSANCNIDCAVCGECCPSLSPSHSNQLSAHNQNGIDLLKPININKNNATSPNSSTYVVLMVAVIIIGSLLYLIFCIYVTYIRSGKRKTKFGGFNIPQKINNSDETDSEDDV